MSGSGELGGCARAGMRTSSIRRCRYGSSAGWPLIMRRISTAAATSSYANGSAPAGSLPRAIARSSTAGGRRAQMSAQHQQVPAERASIDRDLARRRRVGACGSHDELSLACPAPIDRRPRRMRAGGNRLQGQLLSDDPVDIALEHVFELAHAAECRHLRNLAGAQGVDGAGQETRSPEGRIPVRRRLGDHRSG